MKKLSILLACLLAAPLANANLLVTPTRVDLSSSSQTNAVFSLLNKGSSEARYEVYFEDKRMLADGNYETLEEKSAQSISDFVRYSPRRLTLAPEQASSVRLALRAPRDLAEGEYRSYIVFHQIPLQEKASNNSGNESSAMNLTISAYMKVAIPVVLRVGKLDADVSLQASANQASSSLNLTLQRDGNRSTFGDLDVVRAKDGKLLASMKNIAIYTEVNSRTLEVPLSSLPDKGDELIVRYRESTVLNQPKTVEHRLTF